MEGISAYSHGILALDSGYGRRGLAAIHLVVHNDAVAIIDAGTNSSVPRVFAALSAAGVEPRCVRWVMLTHIHLDHAGGAGSLMCALPNARLLVHPRGVRHMIDPAQLWQGVCAVYGAEQAQALYGRLIPVDAERIVEARDGLKIDMNGRMFEVLDTPGHAKHHICIWDDYAQGFFTGDAFGLSYREFDVNGRASVIPTTTPTQFDPQAMHASIDRMLSYRPQAMYLTHYGRVVDVDRLGEDLHRLLDAYIALARVVRGEGEARHREIRTGLEEIVREEAERRGWLLSHEEIMQLLEVDLELNAQGLGAWIDHCAHQAA